LKEIYIDAELDPVDTTQWYPRLTRKDFNPDQPNTSAAAPLGITMRPSSAGAQFKGAFRPKVIRITASISSRSRERGRRYGREGWPWP